MPQASEIAWLIPVFPLIGAVLSGLGLISFNKRINNSREIVSVSLISFVGISAVISYKALIEQVNGYQSVEKLFVWANAGDFRGLWHVLKLLCLDFKLSIEKFRQK